MSPIYDYKCPVCGYVETDVQQRSYVPGRYCKRCMTIMKRQPVRVNFRLYGDGFYKSDKKDE